MFKQTLLTVALGAVALSAQASYSTGTGSLSGSFITLSQGGGGNVVGGALYSASVSHGDGTTLPGDLGGGYAARPWDNASGTVTVGDWLAVGDSQYNNSAFATLTLGSGATGVSFLWGSPDDYNSLNVVTSSGSHTYTGAQLNSTFGITLDQRQDKAYYINFTTGGGETITSLTFGSFDGAGKNAMEIGNVAVVPEPEAYGLALAGLSVVGFAMARRRKV